MNTDLVANAVKGWLEVQNKKIPILTISQLGERSLLGRSTLSICFSDLWINMKCSYNTRTSHYKLAWNVETKAQGICLRHFTHKLSGKLMTEGKEPQKPSQHTMKGTLLQSVWRTPSRATPDTEDSPEQTFSLRCLHWMPQFLPHQVVIYISSKGSGKVMWQVITNLNRGFHWWPHCFWVHHVSCGPHFYPLSWLWTLLMLQPFNAAPLVVVTPSIKLFSLLRHKRYFATVVIIMF